MLRSVGLYVAGLVVVLLAAGIVARTNAKTAIPQRTGAMELPADYRTTFVQYLTVDRSDNITRNLYISPEALANIERGEPLPEGTRIVIEAFYGEPGADGKLIPDEMVPFIHMAEKRDSWNLSELATSAKVGDWNFASFDLSGKPADQRINSENLSDCFTCHDASASPTRDFIFSKRDIDRFALTQEVQYLACPLPDRLPCR